MHVPQIRGAITRDLITKYHYFHTSFQIWPDQIKVGGEGAGGEAGAGKNCTTCRVIRSGVLECRRELVLLKLPKRQFCREVAAGRKFISFSKEGSRQCSCPGKTWHGHGRQGRAGCTGRCCLSMGMSSSRESLTLLVDRGVFCQVGET